MYCLIIFRLMVNNSEKSLRKKRNTVSLTDLNKIQTMRLEGDKISKIARTMDLSEQTIFKALKRIADANESQMDLGSLIKKPGRKSGGLTRTMIEISECIQNDPLYTQKGISNFLQTEKNIKVSQSTISKNIKKLDITRKRVKKVYNKVTDLRIINERRSFALKYRTIPNCKLIYLDETGFNLHTMSHYGYSPKNLPVKVLVPPKGRNISLLSIISNQRILHYKIVVGSYNSDLFKIFLEECLEKDIFNEQAFVIMDNVRFHKTCYIREFFTSNSIQHDYLPPYSPQLNPIEEVFGVLKSRYHKKRPLAQSKDDVIGYIQCVVDEMNNDTCLNFNGFYSNMKHYLELAFMGEIF